MVQAVVKMFRLAGGDKEYGVIKIGAVFPYSERAQGTIHFLRCFELDFLLLGGLNLIMLGTWMRQIMLKSFEWGIEAIIYFDCVYIFCFKFCANRLLNVLYFSCGASILPQYPSRRR